MLQVQEVNSSNIKIIIFLNNDLDFKEILYSFGLSR